MSWNTEDGEKTETRTYCMPRQVTRVRKTGGYRVVGGRVDGGIARVAARIHHVYFVEPSALALQLRYADWLIAREARHCGARAGLLTALTPHINRSVTREPLEKPAVNGTSLSLASENTVICKKRTLLSMRKKNEGCWEGGGGVQ